ncbi:MAG: cobalamin biosynthesis protein CbiG [Phenylobacterium sp.]
MPRLFSAYVIVDWSANSKPKTGADSIWIGVLKRDVRFRMAFEAFNPETRAAAEKQLGAILQDLRKRSERALVGFDFPLGFPRGFAEAMKLPGEAPWRAAWDLLDKMVTDKPNNVSNRFNVGAQINRRLTGGPFPFWGCPANDVQTTLQSKKIRPHGPDDLPEFRHAEVAAKGASPIWKLAYIGSVGSQAILGMPLVRRLKQTYGEAARVWPFETGFRPLAEADLHGVDFLMAEVYPSMVKPQGAVGEVKDLMQVRTLAEYFARLDEANKLGELFGPAKGAPADVVLDAEREEGWILGAGR